MPAPVRATSSPPAEQESVTTLRKAARANTAKALCGCCLALLSSLSFIAARYAIKVFQVAPADSLLCSGVLQFLLFGGVLLCKRNESPLSWLYGEGGSLDRASLATMTAFTVSYGLMILGSQIASKHIPVSFVSILISLVPISSLILGRIWAGMRVSVFKLFLCISLILGVILVVLPQLLVEAHTNGQPELSSAPALSNQSATAAVQIHTKSGYGRTDYLIGICASVVFVIFSSVVYIAPSQLKKVSPNHLLFASSLGAIFVPGVFIAFQGQSEIFEDFELSDWSRGLILLGTGLCLVLTAWLIFVALKLGTPAYVVAMIRRADIIIVLLIDCLFYDLNPAALQWAGAVIVFLSISVINLADPIEKKYRGSSITKSC